MTITFAKHEVLRHQDRDVVLVLMPGGLRQAFYRSSGRSSGRPGQWFPFDGVALHPSAPRAALCPWFDKQRFGNRETRGGPLHRFGTWEAHDVGQALAELEIPRGRPVSRSDLNRWIGTERALEHERLFSEAERELGEGGLTGISHAAGAASYLSAPNR